MLTVVALAVSVVVAVVIVRQAGADGHLRKVLATGDADSRRAVLWRVADHGRVALTPSVARLLATDASRDVREAAAYCLGRLASSAAGPPLSAALDNESSGFVRQAIWLALARADAPAFRQRAAASASQLATERDHSADQDPNADWDELGVIQGRMELGDYRDLERLFALAASADAWPRQLACRAVQRWVAPLMDAAGCWPLAAEDGPPHEWPPELLAEIRRRALTLRMQPLADDCRRHLARAHDIQVYRAKLNKASALLAKVLFRQSEP